MYVAKGVVLLAALAAAVSTEAICPDLKLAALTAGKTVTAPDGFKSVNLATDSGRKPRADSELTLTGDAILINGPTLTALKDASDANRAAMNGAARIDLLWHSEAGLKGEACRQAFDGTALLEPKLAPASLSADIDEICRDKARVWIDEIIKTNQAKMNHFTMVLFGGDGGLCFTTLRPPAEGDPIFVGLVAPKSQKISESKFEPCSREPEIGKIFFSTGFDRGGEVQSNNIGEEITLHKLDPKRCFDSKVDVTVADGVNRWHYAVEQFARYRATLQLGIVLTDQHVRTFSLRPDNAGNQRVVDEGPDDTGPEYAASLVLYGLPKYLGSLFGGERYLGRDIVNDAGFLDRVGGVVGVSLTRPTRRFMAGFAFEAIAGINVTLVYDVAKLNRLNGLAEEDIFSGKVEELPMRNFWDQRWVLGFSLDARYVNALFKGR